MINFDPDRLKAKGFSERNVEEHRAIRQALAAGSAAGARTLAREHVLSSFELLTTILDHVSADWAKA